MASQFLCFIAGIAFTIIGLFVWTQVEILKRAKRIKKGKKGNG